MRSKRFALALLAVVLFLGSLAFAGSYPTQVFPTFTGSIDTETTVATAAAGTHLTIQSAVAQIDTTGAGAVVVFRDGTGGTVVGNAYLTSSTATTIGPEVWGAHGLTLTKSNLTATCAGTNLTLLLRCSQQ